MPRANHAVGNGEAKLPNATQRTVDNRITLTADLVIAIHLLLAVACRLVASGRVAIDRASILFMAKTTSSKTLVKHIAKYVCCGAPDASARIVRETRKAGIALIAAVGEARVPVEELHAVLRMQDARVEHLDEELRAAVEHERAELLTLVAELSGGSDLCVKDVVRTLMPARVCVELERLFGDESMPACWVGTTGIEFLSVQITTYLKEHYLLMVNEIGDDAATIVVNNAIDMGVFEHEDLNGDGVRERNTLLHSMLTRFAANAILSTPLYAASTNIIPDDIEAFRGSVGSGIRGVLCLLALCSGWAAALDEDGTVTTLEWLFPALSGSPNKLTELCVRAERITGEMQAVQEAEHNGAEEGPVASVRGSAAKWDESLQVARDFRVQLHDLLSSNEPAAVDQAIATALARAAVLFAFVGPRVQYNSERILSKAVGAEKAAAAAVEGANVEAELEKATARAAYKKAEAEAVVAKKNHSEVVSALREALAFRRRVIAAREAWAFLLRKMVAPELARTDSTGTPSLRSEQRMAALAAAASALVEQCAVVVAVAESALQRSGLGDTLRSERGGPTCCLCEEPGACVCVFEVVDAQDGLAPTWFRPRTFQSLVLVEKATSDTSMAAFFASGVVVTALAQWCGDNAVGVSEGERHAPPVHDAAGQEKARRALEACQKAHDSVSKRVAWLRDKLKDLQAAMPSKTKTSTGKRKRDVATPGITTRNVAKRKRIANAIKRTAARKRRAEEDRRRAHRALRRARARVRAMGVTDTSSDGTGTGAGAGAGAGVQNPRMPTSRRMTAAQRRVAGFTIDTTDKHARFDRQGIVEAVVADAVLTLHAFLIERRPVYDKLAPRTVLCAPLSKKNLTNALEVVRAALCTAGEHMSAAVLLAEERVAAVRKAVEALKPLGYLTSLRSAFANCQDFGGDLEERFTELRDGIFEDAFSRSARAAGIALGSDEKRVTSVSTNGVEISFYYHAYGAAAKKAGSAASKGAATSLDAEEWKHLVRDAKAVLEQQGRRLLTERDRFELLQQHFVQLATVDPGAAFTTASCNLSADDAESLFDFLKCRDAAHAQGNGSTGKALRVLEKARRGKLARQRHDIDLSITTHELSQGEMLRYLHLKHKVAHAMRALRDPDGGTRRWRLRAVDVVRDGEARKEYELSVTVSAANVRSMMRTAQFDAEKKGLAQHASNSGANITAITQAVSRPRYASGTAHVLLFALQAARARRNDALSQYKRAARAVDAARKRRRVLTLDWLAHLVTFQTLRGLNPIKHVVLGAWGSSSSTAGQPPISMRDLVTRLRTVHRVNVILLDEHYTSTFCTSEQCLYGHRGAHAKGTKAAPLCGEAHHHLHEHVCREEDCQQHSAHWVRVNRIKSGPNAGCHTCHFVLYCATCGTYWQRDVNATRAMRFIVLNMLASRVPALVRPIPYKHKYALSK